jgi:excisionase family DNA binding protein
MSTTIRRQYATQQQAAAKFQVTDRTIRNWIGQGYITGFRFGPRQIRVDLNEIEAMLQMMPATKARDGRKLYGANARIVPVRPVIEAVNVEGGDQ